MSKKKYGHQFDWQNLPPARHWPYKYDAPRDSQWKKDREELFAEHGNGWWWSYRTDQSIKRQRR